MSKVKCLKCGEVLESKYRHDFVMCSCDNQTFVDGGNDYIRMGGKDMTVIALYNSVDNEWTLSYETKED
ncbi:MAG: hypothetical protein WC503_01150 [Candidatus Shapirobacteria bacterium]